MRIGVIADTHIPKRAKAVPPMILDAFAGVDLIIHAGDLVVPEVLSTLQGIAPVEAVAGNNDPAALVEDLGLVRELRLDGYRIGLTHGHIGKGRTTAERAVSQFVGVDCVVFGHSHRAYSEWHGKTLLFNPGSATDRRGSPRCSFGFLYLTLDGIRSELCFVDEP